MDGKFQQDRQVLSVNRLPVSYCLVVADDYVMYEGTDEAAVSGAFFLAGESGAKSVVCFVNGIKVTYSRAVSGV
ncbi:hypothetical protein ccbrp13_52290 [Ktedonobacteria bacterium brp13]|nr:hypothetical protein ccbrp13_52290 [Ktedonobacteria bacterium brp13]